MDIELEEDLFSCISEDKIGTFLSNKLTEICLQNKQFQTLLNERKEALKSETSQNSEEVTVENFWKRVFNNKCIIGFEVVCPKGFEYTGITLSTESNLDYEVHCFTKYTQKKCSKPLECSSILCGAIKFATLHNICYVTLIVEKPQFVYQLHHPLVGYIIYSVNGQKVTTRLPNVEISLEDNLQINWGKEQDSLINFLSVVSSNQCIDLMLCLPEEWTTNMLSTLEIFCSLTAISLKQQNCFITNKTSDTFKDILLVLHQEDCNIQVTSDIFMRVYYPNEDQLISFVHHILSNIKNCQIFPKSLYMSVVLNKTSGYECEREKLDNFKKSLRADLEQSYLYSKTAALQSSIDGKKLKKLRKKLGNQEKLTDLHYLEVQRM